MNRFTEILIILPAILLLLPFMLIISLIILFSSRGGIIYKQVRVGKDNRDFHIYKFRTMHAQAEERGLLTRGLNDPRVTRPGVFLRKYKLDELPQLFNILKGDMSIVGPRPEVRKYVSLYNNEQKKVLSVRPGLTDYASLEYINEGELLTGTEDPERLYVDEIMPAKLTLNLKYLEARSTKKDFEIIARTISRIIR